MSAAAAPECREWEYRNSTDSIEYTVSHFEYRFEFRERPDPVKRCSGGFMVVHIAEKGYLKVTCLAEQEEDDHHHHHHYLQSQQDNFTAELRSQYPDVSGADAAKVATTFMDILQLANAGHRCPAAGGGFFGTLHIIYFKIQPLLRLAAPASSPAELVVIPNNDWCVDDDDEEEEEEEEEEGWPRSQPATRASIMELLKAACSSSSSGDGGECGICMEESEPLPWLRMPCLHSFHRLCLLQWLDNSHSCPLCRYQMPAVQFKLSDHRPNA